MILVDTSVWIDFFNDADTESAKVLRELIEKNEDICLANIHITEILQGVHQEKSFIELKEQFLLFPILSPQGVETYIHAAPISRKCAQRGNPVIKTVDTLIAAIAIEAGVELFHIYV